LVLMVVVLREGRLLLIPLSIALLLAFMTYPVSRWLMRRGMSLLWSVIFCMTMLLMGGALLVWIMVAQVNAFFLEWPVLQTRIAGALGELSRYLSARLGISFESQLAWIDETMGNSGNELIPLLGNTVTSFTEFLYFLLIVPLFAGLILYYRKRLVAALLLFAGKRYASLTGEVLRESIVSYFNFVKGMIVVYVFVGVLNSVGLALLGLPHPLLLGFVAAILTFIPYVGIIAGSLLPIAIAWVNFQSVWYPLAVVAIFTIVQVVEAYVIFPWAVGSRLRINSLLLLCAIVCGGIVWGAVGMIVVVPFIGMLKLVADRVEALKALSLLFGTGKLNG
ncbi:MAG: AI-2E family transporter, partial [Flavobacteriales bacterium]|nr:AI-2E family transporter [Flavobacteriales bacterium]